MKLHIFRAELSGTLFQAYTKDKAGKLLSRLSELQVDSETFSVKRSDWKYVDKTSIDFGLEGGLNEGIAKQFRTRNIAVAVVHYFPHTIYVFDAKFDSADARIYSLDRNLSRFNKKISDISLSASGGEFGYQDLEFLNTITDRYYFQLIDMGIDLNTLVERGFFAAEGGKVSVEEYYRRYLQRMLRQKSPEIFKNYGMEVEDVTVRSVTLTQATESNGVELAPASAEMPLPQRADELPAIGNKPKSNFLRRHAVEISSITAIGLVIIGVIALPAQLLGAFGNKSEGSVAKQVQPIEAVDPIAAQKYKSDLTRYPFLSSFLFGSIEPLESSSTLGRSRVQVYAASPTSFTMIDELSCSYPDASLLRRDVDERYLTVGCSYPSYFRTIKTPTAESTAVIRAWFFDDDVRPTLVLNCAPCKELIITELSVQPSIRQIHFTALTDAITIEPSGRPDLAVEMSPFAEDISKSLSRRFIVQYNDDWSLFALIPRWKTYEVNTIERNQD